MDGMRRLAEFGLSPDTYANRQSAVQGHLEFSNVVEPRSFTARWRDARNSEAK